MSDKVKTKKKLKRTADLQMETLPIPAFSTIRLRKPLEEINFIAEDTHILRLCKTWMQRGSRELIGATDIQSHGKP